MGNLSQGEIRECINQINNLFEQYETDCCSIEGEKQTRSFENSHPMLKLDIEMGSGKRFRIYASLEDSFDVVLSKIRETVEEYLRVLA